MTTCLDNFTTLLARRYQRYVDSYQVDDHFHDKELARYQRLARLDKNREYTLDELAADCDPIAKYATELLAGMLAQAPTADESLNSIMECVRSRMLPYSNGSVVPNETSVTNLARFHQFVWKLLSDAALTPAQRKAGLEFLTEMQTLMVNMGVFKRIVFPPQPPQPTSDPVAGAVGPWDGRLRRNRQRSN